VLFAVDRTIGLGLALLDVSGLFLPGTWIGYDREIGQAALGASRGRDWRGALAREPDIVRWGIAPWDRRWLPVAVRTLIAFLPPARPHRVASVGVDSRLLLFGFLRVLRRAF